MRRIGTGWAIGWLGIATFWGLVVPPTARAERPGVVAPSVGVAAASADEPEAVLQRALALERQRQWSEAIRVYEEALERWPGRTEFRHRLRLCELHYKLGRRYQDQSFRRALLPLSGESALRLYDELLEKVQTHYVDPVPLSPLLRRGLDNLEVALRDPTFLRVNAPSADPERVHWLRSALRAQRDRVAVRDRAEARAEVTTACDLARQALGIASAPIVLEFVFGVCDALDDHSSYLTPDKLDDLYAMIHGNFVGLGVELKLDDDALLLVNVLKGGPAWEAGLKAGDRITHVADEPIRGLNLDEAAGRLQGPEGSRVTIAVLRPDGVTLRLDLVRRPIEVESIPQARIVDRELGVGYVQLATFQRTSVEELERAIHTLKRQGLRYLVLDLRGNPGGLLNVAVDLADQFLDRGVIVSTRGRSPGQSQVYHASDRVSWTMPLIVLIDRDSASASEILAGALKDNRRALVFGQRSFGKGSVQSIYTLRTVPTGLKLTTAKFYSPRNQPYSENGVEPDLTVHTTARPGESSREPAIDFGNPQRDPVLAAALRQARAQMTATR